MAITKKEKTSPPTQSIDTVELFGCFCLCFFGHLVFIAHKLDLLPSNERPIPFHSLEESASPILNMVHNENFQEETFSDPLLVLVLIIVFAIQATLSRLVFPRDLQKTLCVYMVAGGLVHLATESMKAYVGYLRPFFYQSCQPSPDFTQCTNPDYDVDSRRSFPSGHSSTAFCVMTLFSSYLDARFGIGSSKVEREGDGKTIVILNVPTRSQRFISILCILPIGFAMYISSSRIVDNAHFPADVLAGSLLGFGIAKFSHGLWFPSWST